MATTRLMTAEDLWELGDNRNCRRELIRGELRELPFHVMQHGAISATLSAHLVNHIRHNELGNAFGGVGCVLERNPDTVLAPDIAVVRAGRLPDDRDRTWYLVVPPDLIVEVIDPFDLYSEFTERLFIYLDAGVKSIWVVEPSREIVMIYSPDYTAKLLTTDDHLDGGDVLPGFRIPMAEIFT